MIREALRTARTHLIEKKPLRGRETVTDEEIEMLEEKYRTEELRTPDGVDWCYNGFGYQANYDGESRGSTAHPNRELLIKRYLAGINAEIGDFNREVQKIVKADA